MSKLKVVPPEAKYPIGVYVKIAKDNELAKITNAEFITRLPRGSKSENRLGVVNVQEWLYDVEYINPSAPRSSVRYYESDVEKKCQVLLNQEFPSAIYES